MDDSNLLLTPDSTVLLSALFCAHEHNAWNGMNYVQETRHVLVSAGINVSRIDQHFAAVDRAWTSARPFLAKGWGRMGLTPKITTRFIRAHEFGPL